MKRMFGLLVVMTLLYFAIQAGFKLIEKGHTLDYKLEIDSNKYKINEIYTVNTKGESDNYYFNINVNDKYDFDLQTFVNFNMQSQIITDIMFYSDDTYTCILPIFTNGKIITDIICKKDNLYIPYNYIASKDAALDTFAQSLVKKGYNLDKYKNKLEKINTDSLLSVYDNILNNHFLALENYKGIYTLNNVNLKKIYNFQILEDDIYTKDISAFVGKYYLLADYTKETKFNKFTLVNIANNSKSTILYDYDISMDSYVQGVIGNSVYLFDRDTLKQYEIDVKTKTIIEVGNTEVGIKKYINGAFVNISAYDAKSSKITFTKYSTDNVLGGVNYAKVDKTGIAKSGYYYMYEQSGSSYKVYRSNIQNINTKTYLFTTDNLDNVVYYKDCVYYQEKNAINRYSDSNLINTVLENSELQFNKYLKFNVYIK